MSLGEREGQRLGLGGAVVVYLCIRRRSVGRRCRWCGCYWVQRPRRLGRWARSMKKCRQMFLGTMAFSYGTSVLCSCPAVASSAQSERRELWSREVLDRSVGIIKYHGTIKPTANRFKWPGREKRTSQNVNWNNKREEIVNLLLPFEQEAFIQRKHNRPIRIKGEQPAAPLVLELGGFLPSLLLPKLALFIQLAARIQWSL